MDDLAEFEEALTASPVFRSRQRLLFSVLLTLMITSPVLNRGIIADTVLAFLQVAVVLGGVYATSLTSKRLATGLLLAAPAIITSWGYLFQQAPRLDLARMLSLLVIFCYCFLTTLKWVFSARRTGIEELFGAVNSYILIALSFGLIYTILEKVAPGSFNLGANTPNIGNFTYYSFVTIETVGYGDISALRPLARSLSTVEAMVGVFYIAALIGHLVATLPKTRGKDKIRKFDWKPFKFRHPPHFSFLNTVVLVVILNALIPILGVSLDMPFYFDTWGTMVGVMLGGVWAGAVGGALYNIFTCILTSGTSSWLWAFSSVLVAFLTSFCFRRHWLDIHKPLHLLLTGLFIGTCCAALALVILQLSNVAQYDFETALFRLIFTRFHHPYAARALEQLAIDWMDKTLSVGIAAVVVLAVQELILVRGQAARNQ